MDNTNECMYVNVFMWCETAYYCTHMTAYAILIVLSCTLRITMYFYFFLSLPVLSLTDEMLYEHTHHTGDQI